MKASGLNVYINLIPYNEVKEKPFKRSKKEQMRLFYDTLKKSSMNVTLRLEQGADIDAAEHIVMFASECGFGQFELTYETAACFLGTLKKV